MYVTNIAEIKSEISLQLQYNSIIYADNEMNLPIFEQKWPHLIQILVNIVLYI